MANNKRSIFDESDEEEEISSVSLNSSAKSKDLHSKLQTNNDLSPDKKLMKTVNPTSGEHCSKINDVHIENESSSQQTSPEAAIALTAAQRARIEQNRQKALLIKREKMNKKLPPKKKSEMLESEGKKILRINDTKLVDTGGGFFMEEEDEFSNISEAEVIAALRKAEEPAPLVEEDRPRCIECNRTFDSSYLLKCFDHHVCDDCRDNESKHALVTKTDARTEYLLTDTDLEKRQPPLRYIVRKNPHNERWGDMKLYLKLQVEKRCLEVWGSEEALEEEIAKKAAQREVSKQKKFKKKMQELRMNVRSSLYTRATKSHEHEYGPEEHLADDEYSKTCVTCGHSYTYEKL
ncbi:DNA repair protein complementing XP-A cells homolog [Hyalella azteca]|uniref:DNA repair protein complementing XP-A cells homolog n=1 Tax=Hyalella azteca TaxID=294128 RepID=A0A8B7P078_HYAAZ|nr:DNA repair protein complementing XP-A cells homolog [Hyalella azteca]